MQRKRQKVNSSKGKEKSEIVTSEEKKLSEVEKEKKSKRKTISNPEEDLQEERHTKKTKSRKKKSDNDSSYNPKKYDYKEPDGKKKKSTELDEDGNFLSMLYAVDKEFVDTEGKKVAIKTSVMIDYEALLKYNHDKDIDWPTIGEELFAVFNTVPSFRPAEPTEFSENRSPVKLKTPEKGTELIREKKIGFLSFYSNRPNVIPLKDLKSQTELDEESDFYDSASYAAIRTVHDIIKKQEAIITRELLKQTKKENAKIFGERLQNPVMVEEGVAASKGSANKYADATKLFSLSIPMKWEWLHLVAHFIWGEDSQNHENLVAGTKASNADMDSVETQLKFLAKEYPQGFDLVVEADLIEDTHIGINIRYFIKTKDFTLPFEFNTQTPNKPHVSQPDYVRKFVKTLVENCKDKSKQPKAKQKLSFPFFEKNKVEVDQDITKKEEDKKPLMPVEVVDKENSVLDGKKRSPADNT